LKIVGGVINVLTALAYVVVVFVLVIAAPLALGYNPVVVLSGSMEPTYKVGSVIYYKQVAFDDIQVGDVITYKSRDDVGNAVTHRVHAINEAERTLTLKGDANPSPDPSAIPYGMVQGEVMLYELPYVGYMVQYLRNYYFIAALFVVFVAKLLYDRLSGGKADAEEESQ